MERLQNEEKKIVINESEIVSEYYTIRKQLDLLKSNFQKFVMHPAYSVPFLQSGRLILIEEWGWSVCINFQKKSLNEFIVDALVLSDISNPHRPKPIKENSKFPLLLENESQNNQKITKEWIVMGFSLEMIVELSSLRINLPKDLKKSSGRQNVGKSMIEISNSFPSGLIFVFCKNKFF